MTLHLYIPFVMAAIIILIIPGPTVLLVISQAVTHGKKSVIPLVAGVLLGDFTAMTLSLLGLGAIMSASAALFTFFKWMGALYLLYLGINLWIATPENRSTTDNEACVSSQSLLRSSFIVTALNPKSIAFFVAFLPQFVSPFRPAPLQLTLLGVTFLFLATINAALYAVFAGQLREHVRKKKIRRWFNRCGGSALIGAGIFTAAMKR